MRAELRPGRYEIDAGTSSVTFTTRHVFGLLPVRGSFAIRSGTVELADPLGDSRVHAEIDVASFGTGNHRRDGVVRSETYLDADRYPVMTFAADRVGESAVTGTLTVCGVTRPVTLSVEHAAASDRGFTVRAVTRVDRTEFGVTAAPGMTGRHLDVVLEVECVRG